MITQMVPDLEEHPPLLERAGLRNLEDLVIREEIDDRAIVLLKELAKDDLEAPGTSTGFSSKQLWLKELILRVQTEVSPNLSFVNWHAMHKFSVENRSQYLNRKGIRTS